MTVSVFIFTFGYWAYAILGDLMSPAGSFSLIWVGLVFSFLGFFMHLYVDATRKNKEPP